MNGEREREKKITKFVNSQNIAICIGSYRRDTNRENKTKKLKLAIVIQALHLFKAIVDVSPSTQTNHFVNC